MNQKEQISAAKHTELALARLASIGSMPGLSLDEKISKLLRLGTEYLGIPNGVVSVLGEEMFTIRNVVSPLDFLTPGMQYPVEDTLCGSALSSAGTLALIGESARDESSQPFFQQLGIRCYVGTAFEVNGVPYGTICFFDTTPRKSQLGSSEQELLRLFAQWIGYELGRKQALDELHQAREELERLATTDELTGLLNRRALHQLGRHEFERAQRYGHDLCVLALDVDHFKQVNDALGHAAGDKVLERVAACCRGNVRVADSVARPGGEEFTLVLLETPQDHAAIIAERIRYCVETVACDEAVRVTASIGVAELNANDASFQALLARADSALYRAKNSGRNLVCTATELVKPTA